MSIFKRLANPITLIQVGAKVQRAISLVQEAKRPDSSSGTHIDKSERMKIYSHAITMLSDLGITEAIFKPPAAQEP
ncbi:MAG: hypothetical protein AAFX78_04900 [Cyanobacteria bacterium J06638_20]